MISPKLFPALCLAAVGMICFPTGKLCAQSDSRPSATITFANGASITVRNNHAKFRRIGVASGETINIALQLPLQFAGASLVAQALDGGIVDDQVAVAADGTTSLAFQAGVQPGLYRLLLSIGEKRATLQFWVPNPDNPDGT
jgi:hypothetical protein